MQYLKNGMGLILWIQSKY